MASHPRNGQCDVVDMLPPPRRTPTNWHIAELRILTWQSAPAIRDRCRGNRRRQAAQCRIEWRLAIARLRATHQGFSRVRLGSKAQVNGLRVPGRLRHIPPILGGFTVFCSQICSQMSRLAGRSAARRFWTSGFLRPTLPGPGGMRDQARYAQNGSVATVVGRALVVTVVVRTVVPVAVRGIAARGCGTRKAIRLVNRIARLTYNNSL